jgi:Glycosyl transferase 4-like domain
VRVRLFASHLAEFGWHPIVITTAPKYYQCPVDADNEGLLPPGLEIIRTRALPAKWMRRFGIGDIGMRSLWHHWHVIRRLCRSRSIDLVFISVPPYVPMILGRLAYERFGVPYVIDYQDPWITEVYWQMPRSERPPKWPLAYAMSRLLEPFALRRVSHITGVSEGTTRGVLERYPELAGVGATTLPFGAEPADFDFLRAHPRGSTCFDPHDGMVHLVYAGVCIPGMYPALRCLFGGLRLLRERNPKLAAHLSLHFIGTSYASGNAAKRAEPIAAECGVADMVHEVTSRVAYLDALQLLLDAAGLLIVGTNEPHYTASKIYPYALSGRPILAVLHEQSSAVPSLKALAPAHILTFSDQRPAEDQTEEASTQLEALVSDCLHPAANARTGYETSDYKQNDEYTARAMTGKLAAVFDSVLDSGK